MDLEYRTSLKDWEQRSIELILARMPPRVESFETQLRDGCRWLAWPIEPTSTGMRGGRVRLLVDAQGAWHRLTLSLPMPFRTEDFSTEVKFGRRLSNADWLELARREPPMPDGKLPSLQSAPQFLRLLEEPDGRTPVQWLTEVRKRPLVELLASMAEDGFPVEEAISSALPDKPVTVASLCNLTREQLMSVVEALQDGEGRLQLNLNALRHLPPSISGRVMSQALCGLEPDGARALMAVVLRKSAPMGDTSWGVSYCGGVRRQTDYVHRYGRSIFLLKRFAAENGSHEDRVGADVAMRIMEELRGFSEDLPWSVIEALSTQSLTAVRNQITPRAIPFVKFLKDNLATLRKQYATPTTEEGRLEREKLLEARPLLEADPLRDDMVLTVPETTRGQAEAYRSELNAALIRHPSRHSDLENRLRSFCKLMTRVTEPWVEDNGYQHAEDAAFTSRIFAQHDAAIALGDASQSLHHFLELPRAAQQRLATRWQGARPGYARNSLNDRYNLGLVSDDAVRTVEAPALQMERDMLAVAPMDSARDRKTESQSLIQTAQGTRPGAESLLMRLADPGLVAHFADERKARQIEAKEPVSKFEQLSTEAMVDLADHFGYHKGMSRLAPEFRTLAAKYEGPYDPLWIDDPTQRPADDAPRQPRLVSHIELARAVLGVVKARVPLWAGHAIESDDYLEARDAVVEWLNTVESKMMNTSYDARLRLVIGRPSKEAFFGQVSADLRAAAKVVASLPAPRLHTDPVLEFAGTRVIDPEPIVHTPERTAIIGQIIERRERFVNRVQRVADRLIDEDSAVRLAFDTLHETALGPTERMTDDTAEEKNEAWAGGWFNPFA